MYLRSAARRPGCISRTLKQLGSRNSIPTVIFASGEIFPLTLPFASERIDHTGLNASFVQVVAQVVPVWDTECGVLPGPAYRHTLTGSPAASTGSLFLVAGFKALRRGRRASFTSSTVACAPEPVF